MPGVKETPRGTEPAGAVSSVWNCSEAGTAVACRLSSSGYSDRRFRGSPPTASRASGPGLSTTKRSRIVHLEVTCSFAPDRYGRLEPASLRVRAT